MIRVDGIITSEKQVMEFLATEQKDGFPMLPIIEIYQHFDPLLFKNVMENYQKMNEEIKILASKKSKEGDKK